MMAPRRFVLDKKFTIDICSSEVPGGVSIIKQSRLSQSTSVKNCLISPSFLGPRQITGSSLFGKRNPIDITAKLSSRQTGDQPVFDRCTSLPSNPSMRGTLGPHMSMSSSPTSISCSSLRPRCANVYANCVDTVDFPTPPFPESTKIMFFTFANLCFTSSRVGSSLRASPDAQIDQLGQPEHASLFPASSD